MTYEARYRTIDNQTIYFSRHASQRVMEMLVKPTEVRKCLENPQKKFRDRQGRHLWVRGRIALAVEMDDDVLCVKTVMWSAARLWRLDEAVYGDYGRRKVS